MKPGLLPATLLALLLDLTPAEPACGMPASAGAGSFVTDKDGGAMEFDSSAGLSIELAAPSDASDRRFAIEVLVVSNPGKQNFVVNVCTERDCTGPQKSIVASFSFFPAPEAGARQEFNFSLPGIAPMRAPAELHLSIEKLGNGNNADPVALRITHFEEEADN